MRNRQIIWPVMVYVLVIFLLVGDAVSTEATLAELGGFQDITIDLERIPVFLAGEWKAIVNTDSLNMRAGPNASSSIIGTYARGTVVIVFGKNLAGTWLQVEAPDGKRGWMSSRYLRLDVDLARIPIVGAQTESPQESGIVLFDGDPRSNRYRQDSVFCSGFASDCDFEGCAADYRLVWGPYCRQEDYPYIHAGDYRITLFGAGRVRAGATDYGSAREMFAFGEFTLTLPASYTFCWPGREPSGYGFETIVKSLGEYATIDRITVEYLGDSCITGIFPSPGKDNQLNSASSTGGGYQIIVDGSRYRFGPLPVIYYALTAPSGDDIYPLGDGAFALFGLYDTGSTKVRISKEMPNRISGVNWDNSDTGHLRLNKVEIVNIRLNGLNRRSANGNIPIGPPDSANEPQVEVRDIAVKPENTNVTLIGTSVINQLVAHIDYTNIIADPAIEYAQTGVRAPAIDLYWPNDSSIPATNVTLQLEPFGNQVSTDGATTGRRYWLRNVTFQNNDNFVSDKQSAFDFLYDTGTTLTIVNNEIANRLGLSSMSPTFDCYRGTNNGYVIDSVIISGDNGSYQVNNASICRAQESIIISDADAVIGSNIFEPVAIVLDGPQALLGIVNPGGASSGADTSTSMGGFQGIVMERDSGSVIAGVRIIFDREDGALRREVQTGANGSYQIELPEARYRVTAVHPDYQTYSTGSGFFVVTGTLWQTGNIFMERAPVQPPVNEPPTASITVSPSTVRYGELFTVMVNGTDDHGLTTVWWWGDQTGDNNLDKAHVYDCNGALSCNQSWAVSAQMVGILRLCANARDTAYPTPGEPHQASEGAGIPCTQLEVIPAASGCGGVEVGGHCWYLGPDSASCDAVCAPHGGYSEATRTYAGSDGAATSCRQIIESLQLPLDEFFETYQGGIGCFVIQNPSGNYFGYWDQHPTTASATYGTPGRHRICACQQ